MVVTEAGSVMDVRPLASLNAPPAIVASWDPTAKVTLVTPEASNALKPKLVTEAGIVIDVRARVRLNAISPIVVRLPGNVMLVREVLFANADAPILVTGSPPIEAGIVSAVSGHGSKAQPVMVTSPPEELDVSKLATVRP
ncbi:MAG: hypothetical protein WCO96_02315 [Actinomycetes bacterium]